MPHGDRLAPQVIHSPCTDEVSTLLYLTRLSLPVLGSCDSVNTAMGDGSKPYMSLPAWSTDWYSNCTTA
ncbi:hypothetical protein D3C77_727850 [compost metagenome]